LPGAYYGSHMAKALKEQRIGLFPWLPSEQVGTSWDLGHGDSTVVWFYQQPKGGRVRLIDVLEGSGVGIDWYAHKLKQKPYIYADHIWPHDGGHKNIRDVGGETLKTTGEKLGLRPLRVLANDMSVEHGISAVRTMLPLCEFNTQPLPFDDETPEQAIARMERALNALRMYRREWDEKLQKFKDAPLHDWTSHTADSLRYLARGRKPFPGPEDGWDKPIKTNTKYIV
jgi:phage terminase large subunit